MVRKLFPLPPNFFFFSLKKIPFLTDDHFYTGIMVIELIFYIIYNMRRNETENAHEIKKRKIYYY